MVVLAPEPTSEPSGIQVSSVLHLKFVTYLIINNFPVLSLDAIVNFLIIVPVNIFVLLFSFFCNFLEVFESVTNAILMKRIALCKFLKNLESRWEATVAIDVEAEGWLEACWRNNLDAAVLVNFLIIIQVLDIVHWTLELLFSGSKHWHLIDFLQLSVDIFRFHQRILQSLVNQLLLLF